MREIKFRAWRPSTEKMYPGIGLDKIYEMGWVAQDDIQMQYTGLKDKNGIEIYEGDIIEKEAFNRPFSANAKSCNVRYRVVWNEQKHEDNDHNNSLLAKDPSVFNVRPGFMGIEIYNEKGYQNQHWSEFAECEIIGNIYENQDLLK